MHKFPHQPFIDPPLQAKLIDIVIPDVSVVMVTPQVERRYRTPAYREDCVPQRGTAHARRRALQGYRLKLGISEGDEGFEKLKGLGLRVEGRSGVRRISPQAGLSCQTEQSVANGDGGGMAGG